MTSSSAKDFVMEHLSEYGEDMTKMDFARWLVEECGASWSIHTLRRWIPDHEEPETAPAVEPSTSLRVSSDRHIYNSADDLYVFYLPYHKGKSAKIAGEDIRQAKRRYSRWEESGREETINEICADFGWPREFFVQMKTELGWTHDQDPFTTEEHIEALAGERDLTQDLVMLSRGQLERERNIERWKQTVKDAENWRKLQAGGIGHVMGWLENPQYTMDSDIMRGVGLSASDKTFVMQLSDLHIGKRAYDGSGGWELYRVDLIAAVLDLKFTAASEDVGEMILVVGNDWFHIDTPAGTTTRGTGQDIDAPPAHIVNRGYELLATLISLLSPKNGRPDTTWDYLTIVVVPSNHDQWGTFHMGAALHHLYQGDNVQVIATHQSRTYMRRGSNLFVFSHGHNERASQMPVLIPAEAKEYWSECDNVYWHVGHLHHVKEERISEFDMDGIHMLQAPSPSYTDQWHKDNGYSLAKRLIAGYLYDDELGLEARFIGNVKRRKQ